MDVIMPTQIENLYNLLTSSQIPTGVKKPGRALNHIPDIQTLIDILDKGNNITRYLAKFDCIPQTFINAWDQEKDNAQSPSDRSLYQSFSDILSCKQSSLSVKSPAYLYAEHLMVAYKVGIYRDMLIKAYHLTKAGNVWRQMSSSLQMHPDQLRIIMLSYGGLDEFIRITKNVSVGDQLNLEQIAHKAQQHRKRLEKDVIQQWKVHEFPLLVYEISFKNIVIDDIKKRVDRDEPNNPYLSARIKEFSNQLVQDVISLNSPIIDEGDYVPLIDSTLLNDYMSGSKSVGQLFVAHYGLDNIYNNILIQRGYSQTSWPLSPDMIWISGTIKGTLLKDNIHAKLSWAGRYDLTWFDMQKSYMTILGAVNERNVELAKYFVHDNRVQDVNFMGENALIVAIDKGYMEMQEILLGSKIDINHQDDTGYSALMYAAVKDDIKVIKELIDKGANVALKNTDGETVLDMFKNNDDITKLLQSNKENRTPRRANTKHVSLTQSMRKITRNHPKNPPDADDLHNKL